MATGTNTNNEDFTVGTVGDDATHWTMWDDDTGGTLKWSAALANNPAALIANQFYRIEAGDISITIGEGTDGATDSAATDAVKGVFNDTDDTPAADTGRWFQLHDGDPGGTGTANTVTGRIRISDITYS